MAFEDSFWDFSLAFYASPGISKLLIDWQDAHGVDVNIVLCGCWLAARRNELDRGQLQALIDAVEPWRRDVIEPVRSARRAVKAREELAAMPDAQALRQRLLDVELALERSVQQRLESLVEHQAPGHSDASPSALLDGCLTLYSKTLDTTLALSERETLVQALEALMSESARD